MIFDKKLMFFDGDTGAATASGEVDLGNAKPAANKPIRCHFNGTGMTAGTELVITHCDTSGGTFTTASTIAVAFGVLNGGYDFYLPSDIQRYVKLTVTLGAGGTMKAGVVADQNATL